MKNKLVMSLWILSFIGVSNGFAKEQEHNCTTKCSMMSNVKLDKVNSMPQEMQLKLKFDPLVNLPILARTFNQHNKDAYLFLSKEQKVAIQQYKLGTMDSILPLMKSSHELSFKLKEGLLHGKLREEEANEIAIQIAKQKQSVLSMKINCILFFRKTLSKEQFNRLLELDKESFYLNSPYNY